MLRNLVDQRKGKNKQEQKRNKEDPEKEISIWRQKEKILKEIFEHYRKPVPNKT